MKYVTQKRGMTSPIQQFANRLNHFSSLIEEQCTIKSLLPHNSEITNLHKIKALTHRVGKEFKDDAISLEQYYKNNPENLDYSLH
jgi:hypothetical protein